MSKTQPPGELFLPFLQEIIHQGDQRTPRYLQLFRAFQQAITSAVLPVDTRLPASRSLAQSLHISRNTVRTAYEMLLAEGYIESRQGAGSFVCARLPAAVTSIAPQADSRPKVPPRPLSAMARRLVALPDRNPPSQGKLFSLAQPCQASFPWSQWQRHTTAAARSLRRGCDHDVAGNWMLREQIAEYLQVVRGLRCQPQQVMICAGSQQAVQLSLQLLLDAGEFVLVEEPGYQGIEGALASVGAHRVAVPVDEQGFDLRAGLRCCPQARIAMLTPSRNYPLGHTLTLERRLEILHWACEQQAWVLEDDYDSEFRFDGPPLTALQGLVGERVSGADCVIYTGTFTRILHPSIRLGYLVLPEQLIEPFKLARRYLDGGLPQLPQQALATFMASGQFGSHVRRMRKLYQQRRDYLNQQVKHYVGNLLTRVPADGGMHTVYLLPEGYDDQQLCMRAEQQGLGIRALSRFYSQLPPQQGLVIGFAGYSEQQISEGLRCLEGLLKRLP
ncbi:MAG: PLP-dependent aminotransferase family protein [Marinobacterium sp.]|nr:PLP-dependent aminotransferase family protein [Marinobacterium sp.]